MASCARRLAVVLVLASATAVAAQPADQTALFKEAAAREAAVRRELTAARPAGRAPAVRRARTLVGSYEDLARLFPTVGQADKALWQGANLSADLFWQMGEAQDRDTALRLLETLTSTFNGGSYARQAPPLERRLHAAHVAAAVPVPAVEPKEPAPRAKAEAPSPRATPVAATESGSSVALIAVRRELLPEAARVTLELDREVAYHSERIAGPDRVFVDLPQTRPIASLKYAILPYTDDVVRRVRVGAQPNHVTRVVLDLEGGGRHSVYTLYNPYRIVIDVERTGTVPAATPAAPAISAAPTPAPVAVPVPVTARTLPASAASASPHAPRATPPPPAPAPIEPEVEPPAFTVTSPPDPTTRVAVVAPPPVPPAVNGRGGFSLSRQLGLGIARIVIDAGHGGHDPGAKVKGLNEADLTLDVALRLEKLLLKQPGVEVIQTRRTNAYVPLEERTEIANRSGADLFVSIHANASSDARARGVETYFLNFAPNAEAEAIAARENAGSNRQMRQLPDLVKAIALNNKIDESRDLAAMVQQSLYTGVRKTDRRVRNLGVKQAPFMVLVGAAMPSILTEISFVTNQQEADLLATDKYRQQIAEALLAGITRYQQSLKKTTSIATQ